MNFICCWLCCLLYFLPLLAEESLSIAGFVICMLIKVFTVFGGGASSVAEGCLMNTSVVHHVFLVYLIGSYYHSSNNVDGIQKIFL